VEEGEGDWVVPGMYSSRTGRWRGGDTMVNGGGGQRSMMWAWFGCGWEELGVGVAVAEYGKDEGPFYRVSGGEIRAIVSGNGVLKSQFRKARKIGREMMGWSHFSRGGEVAWAALHFV
jgi:hypothetical protein